MSSQCYGIDFGTTSSATVQFYIDRDNKIHRYAYGDGEGRPIPSAVAIDKQTGKVYTGWEAKSRRQELSKKCEYISSIKHLLGEEWEKEINGKIWTPVEVAAEVFKTLKKVVYDTNKNILNEAIVAIPVGFEPLKRERLRKAAQQAGITIRSFISEPTAAFFANYKKLQGSSNVAVFDWGGGTLDVSILKHTHGKIQELATTGMAVAGDDIDRKLAERIHAKFSKKKHIQIDFEDMPDNCQDILITKAEQAKRILSDDDAANIAINKYGSMGTVRDTVEYTWFEDIIRPEIEQAVQCLDQAIADAGIGEANIDSIIMVGGSSELEPLRLILSKRFGDKLLYPEETMWNVAEGAGQLAVQAGQYYSNQHIGIRLSDGSVYDLLKPGMSIRDFHETVSLGITDMSEEARLILTDENHFLDRKVISIPTYRFLQEKIELEAVIDVNLVFKISAKSNYKTEKFRKWWEYSNLKFYYQLPEGGMDNG